MNAFANIWQHPKTSLAGVLIAVVTIAGVMGQQGVTLGKLGNGTVITFLSALATALLGMLAKDPETGSKDVAGNGADTAKLGAWMLVALLVYGTLPMAGCTSQSVAQQIVNWTPSLTSAVNALAATAAALDPADASAIAKASAGVSAAATLLSAQASAYLAAPTASTLTLLQNQIVSLQQQVNSALLQTSQIGNAQSQQHVAAEVQTVATIATAILSLVESVSSKSDVQRMASTVTVKLADVQPLMNAPMAERLVAEHYQEPVATARAQMAEARMELVAAGF